MSTPEQSPEPSDEGPKIAGKIIMWTVAAVVGFIGLYAVSMIIKLVLEVWIAISHL